MKALVAVAVLPVLLIAGTTAAAFHEERAAAGCWLGTGAAARPDETLDSAQVANARTIVSVARAERLPARAAVIAVATARQESGLRNLPYGDRDSLGLFQQRPSQGWGTAAQVMDPVHASISFYGHLVAIPRWPTLPLTVAAQAVQRSAFPDAYARWEPLAVRVVGALDSAVLSCEIDHAADGSALDKRWPPESMGPDGLTARTRAVRDAIRTGFGLTDIGGYCPGGCTGGHGAESDHYTGHAIDVMLLPIGDANRQRGNQLAAWLEANATRYAIKYVIWNGRIWSTARSGEGWRPYTPPSGPTTDPTLMHRDHVHVSVN